jgi:hypothetical protein
LLSCRDRTPTALTAGPSSSWHFKDIQGDSVPVKQMQFFLYSRIITKKKELQKIGQVGEAYVTQWTVVG